MPELPEVETVRRGLARLVQPGTAIERVTPGRRPLRRPLPRGFVGRLAGQTVLGFRRWGKYLLWDTPAVVLVNHLGMTGTWRVAPPGEDQAHDHCFIELSGGLRLAYRDPRRFGLLALAPPGGERLDPGLGGLGPDPFDARAFHAAYLRGRLRGRRAAIKGLLLDQRLVAGIGNIYAAEALYRAGIRPTTPAGRLSLDRLERLVAAVREVLDEAIRAGGSTLRDYRRADGDLGTFQDNFAVYGREAEPCLACATPLRGRRIAGRATAWCPRCQS